MHFMRFAKLFQKIMSAWISAFLKVMLLIYRYIISPLKPPSCRFYPTCSDYALQSIEKHGPLKGVWLTLRRLSRCHPWGSSGIDPVPSCKERDASSVMRTIASQHK
jgi:putative membrane protein insertion efficiency factor